MQLKACEDKKYDTTQNKNSVVNSNMHVHTTDTRLWSDHTPVCRACGSPCYGAIRHQCAGVWKSLLRSQCAERVEVLAKERSDTSVQSMWKSLHAMEQSDTSMQCVEVLAKE